jgi:hypothetical protein
VFCDVEGIADETEFLKHLCQSIERREALAKRAIGHLQQRFKQVLSDGNWSTVQEALGRLDWKSFSDTLVGSLNAGTKPTLILIDEMSLFVAARLRHDRDAALNFLYHLRRLRQRYPNVRWMFTGSIGLDVVARGASLSGALLGLRSFPLEPFTSAAARAFLNHLCETGAVFRPFDLTDEGFAHFEAQLGWLSPYYLEELANQVQPSGSPGPNGRPTATIDDIGRAFESLLAPQHRLHFAAWEEHIPKNFDPPDRDRLLRILNKCGETPEGEQFSTLQAILSRTDPALTTSELRNLLTVLVTDGFLDPLHRDYDGLELGVGIVTLQRDAG